MPKSRSRKKPKPRAATRKPLEGSPRSRPMRMELEAVTNSIMNSPPLLAPIVALLGLWVWNAAEDQAPAASCVDAGLIFVDALAQYGISARLEPVLVTVCRPYGTPITRYGATRPHWNPDGTFNGHAVITLPDIGRFADATIQQFPEVPSSARAQMPLIAPMPAPEGLGTDPFVIVRRDHVVQYQGFPGDYQHLWTAPLVHANRAGYRAAAANLAANVFDLMRRDYLAPKIRQAPYPRLHQLLDELDGADAFTQDGRYVFRHPGTGRPIQLTDIPLRS